MTCDRVRAWLSASIDGEASPSERYQVDRHLAGCPACSQVKAAAAALRVGLRYASSLTLQADAKDELVITALLEAGVIQPFDPLPGLDAGGAQVGSTEQKRKLPFWPSVLPLPVQGSLRSAAVAMAVAFLVTWWPLRLAERGPLSPVPNPARTSTPGRALTDRLISAGWWVPPWQLATVLLKKREDRVQRAPAVSPPGSSSTRRSPGA